MSSPSIRYRKRPEVRVREVAEMEFCLAYVPARRELYRLNPSAWFVLRHCEGRSEARIARDYREALPELPPPDCAREVRKAIEQLEALGIIEPAPRQARSATRSTSRRKIDAHAK